MTSTTDFIAELIRAANEVGKLTAFDKERLLDRAIAKIRYMRATVGIPVSGTDTDALIQIGMVSSSIGFVENQDVATALLDAASMLRDLRIVIDTQVDVLIGAVRDEWIPV